jgi:lipoprotein-releasing system permease protein
MNLVPEIAWTHVSSRVRQTTVAVLGVTCGVVLTLLLTALIEGMQRNLITSLVDAMAHITVSDERRSAQYQPAEDSYGAAQVTNLTGETEKRRGIRNPTDVIAALRAWLPGAIAPSVKTTGVISYGNQRLGVTLAGIDPRQEEAVSKLATYMRDGQLNDLYRGSNAVLIGDGLAKKIGARVGTSITLSAGEELALPASVVGIFHSGLQSADEGQVYSLMRTVQVLAGRPGMINELRMHLNDPQAAREIARRIEAQTGYRAVSWQEANADLLSTFTVQRTIGYMVIAAMLLASTLGIYSIISTITNEKRSDIAIMKSFGMREGVVRSIFILEAMIIGAAGIPMGWLFGWLLCQGVAKITVTNVVTGQSQGMPVHYTAMQYLAVAAITVVACTAAGFFPARKASRVHPVDIIRGAT